MNLHDGDRMVYLPDRPTLIGDIAYFVTPTSKRTFSAKFIHNKLNSLLNLVVYARLCPNHITVSKLRVGMGII